MFWSLAIAMKLAKIEKCRVIDEFCHVEPYFSIGVHKFLVTARYENFQNLKLIIFNVDFSRHVVCSISDFLILERVSGPLGGPAVSYPRKRIQVKIQVYRIYTDHLKLTFISVRNPCKPDLYWDHLKAIT